LRVSSLLRRVAAAALVLALSAAVGAAAPPAERTALRVCADPHNLPFSDQKGEGFENRIAALVGRDLSLPVEYFWFPQVIGFVRVGLKGGHCDLVIGTVAGDDLMQTTTPYYRTGYMLVFRRDHPVSANLDDPSLKGLHIGVVSGTPPSDLLVRHGLMAHARPYHLTVDTRVENPAHQLLLDVASGTLDAGMVWGPFAGYYITHDKLPLVTVQLHQEPNLPPLTYRIAMGTRYGEPEWHRRIEEVLARRHDAIVAILRDYGVPLLDKDGKLVQR
jgi:quinoprotein dehydrogenase-associated probable ABC transporter substrate-binding protein